MVKVLYFNPRSREGSDIPCWIVHVKIVISIHAPVKGATNDLTRRHAQYWYFNLRSREGSDKSVEHVTHVSCHFNPRSREGSDNTLLDEVKPKFRFQSTLP